MSDLSKLSGDALYRGSVKDFMYTVERWYQVSASLLQEGAYWKAVAFIYDVYCLSRIHLPRGESYVYPSVFLDRLRERHAHTEDGGTEVRLYMEDLIVLLTSDIGRAPLYLGCPVLSPFAAWRLKWRI